jgi:hypothetical protein
MLHKAHLMHQRRSPLRVEAPLWIFTKQKGCKQLALRPRA